MIIKFDTTTKKYICNANIFCAHIEEVFEYDCKKFFFVDFSKHKEAIFKALSPFFNISDFGIAFHINDIIIGDFTIKFGQKFENWEQALALDSQAGPLDTFAADAVNDFILWCGHGNYNVGAKTLRKIYPLDVSAEIRNIWNLAKENTKPLFFAKKGVYEKIFEFDLKKCYRSIMENLPLPSGRPCSSSSSCYNIFLTQDNEGEYRALGEFSLPLYPNMKIIRKISYKTAFSPLGNYVKSLPYEMPAPFNSTLKMGINSLVGSFGRREKWDFEQNKYTSGYYPVYIAVVDYASSVLYKLIQRLKPYVVYANTDSIFLTENKISLLEALSPAFLKWRLAHVFTNIDIRGINNYTGITADNRVLVRHSGVQAE